MAAIFEGMKMSEPVVQASSKPALEASPGRPALALAREKGIEFLRTAVPDVRRVEARKAVWIDTAKGAWELEFRAFVPNATIRNLGLPVQREVLESLDYVLRVNTDLEVVAYGLRDDLEERNL